MAIKLSGVEYETMKPEDIVILDLIYGKVVGKLRPSSDTPTHLKLYKAFPEMGGVTHSHSINAVAFAQAGMPIPSLSTTHADYFYGVVPCTWSLTKEEMKEVCETNTGNVKRNGQNEFD